MSEIDVNDQLKQALQKRWGNNLGGWHVQSFDTSKVLMRILQIEYPGFNRAETKKPTVIAEQEYTNDGNTTITDEFTYSGDTTAESEWHVTGGLKLTAGAKGKAGVPLVAEGEASYSAEVDFEAGGGGKTSKTDGWSHTVTITVPPETRVKAEALVTVGTITNQPFKAHVQVYGQVGAVIVTGGPNPIITSTMWGDIETGKGWVNPNFGPLSKPPLDPKDLLFTAEGTYSGTSGLYVNVTTTPMAMVAA